VAQNGNESSNGPGGNAQARTPVAQLAEQRIPNPQVAGSSPSRRVEGESDSRPRGSDPRDQVSYGIYKYGQGYWVRVGTAFLLGLLITAFAGWIWKQLELVPVPTPTWQLTVTDADAAMTAGSKVDLVADLATTDGRGAVIGQATLNAASIQSDRKGGLTIGEITIEGKRDPTQIEMVRMGQATALVSRAEGVPSFELIYLQGGVAGLLLLGGSLLVFWVVARRARTVEFLISTDGEMRKVNWSTRKEIWGSTSVVVAATFLIAGILFGFDVILQGFFTLIRVLER
jgi:preprotein translocase SecE subunit